ncbi:MAG: hypothetical protein OEZ38_05865 [Gammaproteobacteria bacterium]|nr:hypothetical protein [Gammaproteobacteria bacterium]
MQPRTLALLVCLLPPVAANLAYIISASAGHVPWCIPYIDGCTSISRAARHGHALFVFRALMMFYAVLLLWYWWTVKHWLIQLDHNTINAARLIYWLGVIGALFLVIYIDYLGSSGDVYRFLRRYGVIMYFSLTPLAHLLMLKQLKRLSLTRTEVVTGKKVQTYQLLIITLIVLLGIVHVIINYAGLKSDQTQNIIEWNYALLMTLFFASSYFMWKNLKLRLQTDTET